jgi:anti-anti-sigma factor
MPAAVTVPDHGRMLTDTRAEVLVFGDEALISVFGELDLFSLSVLKDALVEVRAVSRVVIDLQNVSFLDCSALRYIELAARAGAADGQSVRVDHASGMVHRLIELLKLDDLRVR